VASLPVISPNPGLRENVSDVFFCMMKADLDCMVKSEKEKSLRPISRTVPENQ